MKDLELIYLIRESKNKDAFNYLLNKYWTKVYKYTYKWYSTKYLLYSVYEKEMEYIMYDCFLKIVLESNLKFENYVDNFFPKLWFILCRNTILNNNKNSYYEETKYLVSNNFDDNCENKRNNLDSISCDKHNGIHFNNNIFVEYILDLANKFLKDNRIETKNKKWIIDKLSSGGARTVFDEKDFNEKEKVYLWRQYKKIRKFLRTQVLQIVN